MLIILCGVIIFTCSSGKTGQPATVVINTGLGTAKAVDTKAPAPANVASFTLSVTNAGGDEIINQSITPSLFLPGEQNGSNILVNYDSTTGMIRIDNLPGGVSYTFTVTANTPSATLRGQATQEILSGVENAVSITVSLTAVKLIIPDYSNNRIVQFDDMTTGTGWKETQLGLGSAFLPNDIDFDSKGRIYIVNNIPSGAAKILRINSIASTTYETIVPDTGVTSEAVTAIAVDRDNNLIYFADSFQLYRCDLNGGSVKSDYTMVATSMSSMPIEFIRGLAINENNILFIAWGSGYFTSYDPNQGTTGAELNTLYYSASTNEEAWDMVCVSSYIYGAFFDIPGGSYIIYRFSLNAGNQLVQDGTPYSTSLYGPHRFISTLATDIIFIDENSFSDRLVSIEDISGAGRIDFGATGSGEGQFNFWSY